MAKKRGDHSIQKVIEFYRLLAKGIRESIREWEQEDQKRKRDVGKNGKRDG